MGGEGKGEGREGQRERGRGGEGWRIEEGNRKKEGGGERREGEERKRKGETKENRKRWIFVILMGHFDCCVFCHSYQFPLSPSPQIWKKKEGKRSGLPFFLSYLPTQKH